MANEKKLPNTFNFVVDSALLSELGERLVSTAHVALAELVKNAYDADAKSVKVRISPEPSGAPRVVVEDDGTGMSRDDVRRFWMKIGTVNKVDNPTSARYGRPRTGSKGIGRFACRRLGLNLKLTTTARSKGKNQLKYETTIINFAWNDFKPGTDVEEIPCIATVTRSATGKTGTKLEMWGGKVDEWRVSGFQYLQRQLAVLASNRGAKRPGFQEDRGFGVELDAPGLSGEPVDVREAVIAASWGTLTATVDSKGRAVCSLSAKGLGGIKRFTSKQNYTHIAGAALKIGVLPAVKDEARKPEMLANYVLAQLISEWGGVQIRFNGFRVYPYGDSGDDWLQIDADRGRRLGKPKEELFDFASTLKGVDASRVLLTMLGMRNYLGQVEVSSDIPGLMPRIDRQGFVASPALNELRDFVRFSLDWANIHRDNYIRMRDAQRSEIAKKAIKPVLDLEVQDDQVIPKAASFLKDEIRQIAQSLPEKQRHEKQDVLIKAVQAIETISVASNKQLKHLRQVASAATLTILFAHEIRTVIGTLGAASRRLAQLARDIPQHKKKLSAMSTQLQETKDRFDNLVGMTGIVGAIKSTNDTATFHLKESIERAIQCFHIITDSYGIIIDDEGVPADIAVGPMIEGELFTILLNVLSNAVKSVIAAGQSSKIVRFDAIERDKKIVMTVSDTGVGLAPEFYEDVFTPFISDPGGVLYDRLQENSNSEDSSFFGGGSGLGLPIARDIARSRGGDIRFVSPDPSWNASLEITLP